MPRYVFVNATDMKLQITQHALIDSTVCFTLGPRSTLPFHWLSPEHVHKLCMRVNGPAFRWSYPFAIHEIGDFHIKLGRSPYDPRAQVLVLGGCDHAAELV